MIYGSGSTASEISRALVWSSTSASSAIDMSQFLPVGYSRAFITGVDSNGNFYGAAYDSNGNQRAIEWTAVPEPAALVLMPLLALVVRRRR